MTETGKTEKQPSSPALMSFNAWLNEFRLESDRAAVILGAAKLDLTLRQLLTKVFLPTTSGRDELFDTDQPLSTYSARINVAYRIGQIDREFARALHLVRRIRNDFAHEAVGSDLNSGAHRDRVRELAAPYLPLAQFDEFQQKYFSQFEGSSRLFRAVLTLLLIRLEGRLANAAPLGDERPAKIIPPVWLRNRSATPAELVAQTGDKDKPA